MITVASTWLSIEAPDIDQAEAWLRDSGVEVLQGQKFHLGVMLTDLIVADADGNPVQIVEYHGPVSWRNAARRMLFGREH